MPNRKLTQKEYDQYLLGSNRIHGDWDWQAIADNFDFGTLLVSGFDDSDMTHIFDDLEVEDDESQTFERHLFHIGLVIVGATVGMAKFELF